MSVRSLSLRDRNIELFRRIAPQVLERIKPHLDHIKDVPPPSGKHKTLRFNGNYPNREDIDAQTFAFLSNLLLRADAQKIAFLDHPRTPEAFYLLICGLPDDSAFEKLFNEFKPGCFIIVEPDEAKLAASLSRIDWATHIFKTFEKDVEVHFILDKDANVAAGNVWRLCRRVNPGRADNFASVLFDHEQNFGLQLIEGLTRDLNLVGTHLGFFHDELTMLWNSFANLTSGRTHVYHRDGAGTLHAPVFVVGSGPSLDADLEVIRAHQDDAVIVSAGSALRPLLNAGIRPDFQVESENWDVTTKYDQIAGDFDISGINLVASVTVEQEALSRFHQSVLYFRLALTPYAAFSGKPESGMRLPDPTVGNAALCFAIEAGFQDVYIFGLDLGSADQQAHHSKASFYNTQEGVRHDTQYDIPVAGNFRDQIWTSKYFLPAVKNAEDLARGLGKDRHIVNCSDGAKLAGTEAVRGRDLKLDPSSMNKGGKAKAVARLLESYPAADADTTLRWDGDVFSTHIARFGDDFRALLQDQASFADGSYQQKVMTFLQLRKGFLDAPTEGLADAVLILFRGTLLSLFLFTEFYRLRGPPTNPGFASWRVSSCCVHSTPCRPMLCNFWAATARRNHRTFPCALPPKACSCRNGKHYPETSPAIVGLERNLSTAMEEARHDAKP